MNHQMRTKEIVLAQNVLSAMSYIHSIRCHCHCHHRCHHCHHHRHHHRGNKSDLLSAYLNAKCCTCTTSCDHHTDSWVSSVPCHRRGNEVRERPSASFKVTRFGSGTSGLQLKPAGTPKPTVKVLPTRGLGCRDDLSRAVL